jgi:hypothetical protein
MANEFKTLADQAKETDPSGKALTIVEYINQVNELSDIPSVPSMTDTDMIGVRRIGLPQVTRRKINQGVEFTKSKGKNFRDSVILYEAHGAVDADIIDIATDKAAVRMNENAGHMQAMGEAFAYDLFKGSVASGAFNGFETIYNKIDGKQVLSAGGNNNLTSIYLVAWSPNTVTTFYPKNSKAGIEHEALAKQLVDAPDGKGQFMAYPDVFKWKVGLSVKNPKYAVRIANIDVANLTDGDLFDLLISAKNKIPTLNGTRPRIYCNESIFTRLEQEAFKKSNLLLNYAQMQNSTPVLRFGQFDLKKIEALTSNETKIS